MNRCIVIDDEPWAIEALKKYIDKVNNLELIKSYTDPLKALEEISKGEKIDLILMDVDMPEISGIELAWVFRRKRPSVPHLH